MRAQEVDKERLALGEIVGGEAEEVHADGGVGGQGVRGTVGVGVGDAVSGAGDGGALRHADKESLSVGLTHAAADGAVLREGVFQTVAHHAVAAAHALEGAQVVGHDLEGVATVEVVGIDDGERLVDELLGHEDGVVGPPGLLATFGDGEAGGQAVELLIGVLHLDAVSVVLGIDARLELLLKGVADDEDHLAEAGADGVFNAVVEDDFPVGAEAVELLETAVAATHAGGKDE